MYAQWMSMFLHHWHSLRHASRIFETLVISLVLVPGPASHSSKSPQHSIYRAQTAHNELKTHTTN